MVQAGKEFKQTVHNDATEAAWDRKVEKYFKSHRELPTGRDFRWNMERDRNAERRYRMNFDQIFPDAPGVGI
jgi:hypothetical protein